MRCWFLCTIFSAPHKISQGISLPYLLIKVCFSPKSTLSNTRFLRKDSFCLVLQYLSVRKEERWMLLLLATKRFLASSKWILISMSRKGPQTDSTFLLNYFVLRWCQTQWRYGKDRATKALKFSSLCACVFLFQSDRSTGDFFTLFWKDICKVVWGLFSYFPLEPSLRCLADKPALRTWIALKKISAAVLSTGNDRYLKGHEQPSKHKQIIQSINIS